MHLTQNNKNVNRQSFSTYIHIDTGGDGTARRAPHYY